MLSKVKINHHNSESTCHTKFNIIHCKQHTQKPVCRDCQAFTTLLTCWNWHFFLIFGKWPVMQTAKNFTFCWFWLGKLHQNGLSGMYIGFQVCWIQWHWFGVPTISSSWKIKIWGEKYIKWVKNHQNRMGPMQQCFLGPILPLAYISEPYV